MSETTPAGEPKTPETIPAGEPKTPETKESGKTDDKKAGKSKQDLTTFASKKYNEGRDSVLNQLEVSSVDELKLLIAGGKKAKEKIEDVNSLPVVQKLQGKLSATNDENAALKTRLETVSIDNILKNLARETNDPDFAVYSFMKDHKVKYDDKQKIQVLNPEGQQLQILDNDGHVITPSLSETFKSWIEKHPKHQKASDTKGAGGNEVIKTITTSDEPSGDPFAKFKEAVAKSKA